MARSLSSKLSENDHQTFHAAPLEHSLKLGKKPQTTLCGDHRNIIRAPSPDPAFVSINDIVDGAQSSPHAATVPLHDHGSVLPAQAQAQVIPNGVKGKIYGFWTANKGLGLVLIAQLFCTLMTGTTRMLEVNGNNGKGYHPLQVLFFRMSITVPLASFHMWYKKTEHFPLGMREVRPLLLARGVLGFFGVFGMYYSLQYLPLSDATVITFLSPSLTCWACSILINQPFTRMEQIAAYISLFGVVLIARPASLFAVLSHHEQPASSQDRRSDLGASFGDDAIVTPGQRAVAVAMAMVGVVGAAGAYTTLRWIGKRAQTLLTVNYFSVCCAVFSLVAMLVVPSVGFLFPTSWEDWSYLIVLSLCGFIMQFLLAAGLQHEKSSRATNMMYMQMIFALAFDKVVFGATPSTLSIIGSSLILGSAIYVALYKEDLVTNMETRERGDEDEERGLMAHDAEVEQIEAANVPIALRPLR